MARYPMFIPPGGFLSDTADAVGIVVFHLPVGELVNFDREAAPVAGRAGCCQQLVGGEARMAEGELRTLWGQ